ncbi:HlyD family secretion protein [Sandarakinorhabdus sp.]|uniref:HlyD family secretion protein n=1 Tax=Sandarakinorhabdus sp. TaxID=1916663 RepID=UPI00286E7C06|nr:HlyD family secretion protein [Sandarakinorhabdus sp.]
MTQRFETIIRSRRLRMAAAVAMAATALWAFSPYVTSEVGGEAYVSAPLIRIASPIAGMVASDLPAAGTALRRAETRLMVTAHGVDTSALLALRGEAAALAASLALTERQIGELRLAGARLSGRSRAFGAAAQDRLGASLAAARDDVTACHAESAEAVLQRDRTETLAAQRFATFTQRDRARAVAASAAARCAALAGRAQALDIEGRAAAHGLYLAGAAMDASYGDQQRDRLVLRRQELESIAANARTRLAQLDGQIAAEDLRTRRAAAFAALLPASTIVWSQPAARGTSVAAGGSLIELADCQRRYVEVSLPERRMEAILPGARAKVRLIGSDQWQNGHVASVMGAAGRPDGAMVAANPDHDARALTVTVALPPPVTLARRCDVGRLAEVRFDRW